MKKKSRKEREYLIHREEILRAAEKVFATKGFFRAKMSEIAKEAEFGTGTLYQFFKSKEDLYFSLIDDKVEEINRLVKEELLKQGPAIERIQKVLSLQFDFVEKNRDFFKIYISERNRFEWTVKEDLGKGIHEKMVTYIYFLSKVFEEGILEGTFKPLNPLDMAHSLVGMTNAFIFEWLISPTPFPLASKKEILLEIFLTGTQKKEGGR
ncbi:MAG: TetR/AcrR family transcriptional regulator [Thermodesulfobacteriota bacterium]